MMGPKDRQNSEDRSLDDRTMIPLTWAVIIMVTLIPASVMPAIQCAMWVKGVNDHLSLQDVRFSRIEVRLGIHEEEAGPIDTSLFLNSAEAGPKSRKIEVLNRRPNTKK